MKTYKFNHQTYREYVVKRKARKEYDCSECYRIIRIGEEYYADHFASSLGSQMTGNPYSHIGQQSWVTKKVCEDCWKGIELRARKLTRKDFEPDKD